MASLENEMKMEQFENEIKDERALNKKLKILFLNEYDEIIGDILNLKDELFIDQVKEGVSLLLEDFYTINCLTDERLSKLVENNLNEIKERYNEDYTLINKTLSTYEKTSKRRVNSDIYLSGFRKHCIHTNEFASHNCCSNEKDGDKNCHFIIVNNSDPKKEIKFVVCENCKKVYYSSFILAHCYKCGVDYYTSLLSPEENPELLCATWENYHCRQIMNEKMKCIKCNEPFYINMKTGLLMCLNKKCEFISKPTRIMWTCIICKTEFKSGAIPYNPLDVIVTKRLVSQTLLLKHKAHPNKMPCCKINVFFTDFHHKNTCDGILYESELDDNKVVVCEKCKAINFFERFHWTCPKCGKRFKDKSSSSTTENSHHNAKEENNYKKEKEIDEIENRKINTPKPGQYASKRFGLKKERELKEFKLNNDKENVIEENIEDEKEDEKRRNDNIKKIDSSRKYRRFNFNYIHENKNKNEEKNKDLEKSKNEEKNEEKKEEKNEEKNEENNEDNDNEELKNRKTRSRTAYYKEEKRLDEGKKYFRRFKYDNENKDKDKINEEKEKEKEVEQEQVKVSPRMQWRKRYKRDNASNRKESNVSQDVEKRELEERQRKEKEEKERRELEEKERREREENELKNKNKEENLNGRGWFRRLAAGREKGKYSIDKKEFIDKSTKSPQKEKEKEKETESIDNNEESEENNSIDNNDENNIIKFGKDESDEEDEKEKEENPVDPDPLYMNYKFKRSKNKKKTRGMEIIGDQDQEENKDEEEEKKIKKKNPPQKKIAMSKIPGISEHLFNHINKRMNKILNRCKIPVFNIDDYTFNKKLGQGGYAVIFSVHKNDDKEHKELALKKIIAKTLTEIDRFTKEFELVHSCIHPNIMKIYGICIRMLDQTTYALYVLMELSYCDWNKEIKMHLMKKKNYKESELINILRQLTSALLFMQQNLKISHRDIKPSNVLLFKDGLYKIADFGEAKEAKHSKQMNTLRGTELYMSPALYSGLKNERNDVNHDPYKSDVFSLGFCFLYAASLNLDLLYQVRDIFNSKRMNDILQQQFKKKYSQTFIYILSKMMEVDEIERFDFPNLVNFIEENYDKDGNLKNNEEKNEKKPELSYRKKFY